uniref:Beta-defensin n=1 Tax=Nothoprocta perdicaria TaxID=30464 RepID=A0A8C6Z6V7_NOTPE
MSLLCINQWSHLSLAPIAGYGQPKNICKGYCSKTCTLTDQWTFHAACGKRFCCQPLRRKGK